MVVNCAILACAASVLQTVIKTLDTNWGPLSVSILDGILKLAIQWSKKMRETAVGFFAWV